jgi:hypothetical protein
VEIPAGKMITKGTLIDLLVIKNKADDDENTDSTALESDIKDEDPPVDEKSKRKKRKTAL